MHCIRTYVHVTVAACDACCEDDMIFSRLDAHTTAVMQKGLEDSLGDEGYAAWLQYREIQKLKRDREALKMEEVDIQGEGVDSKWLMVNVDQGMYAHVDAYRHVSTSH